MDPLAAPASAPDEAQVHTDVVAVRHPLECAAVKLVEATGDADGHIAVEDQPMTVHEGHTVEAAENGKGPSLHAEVARLKTQLNEVQRDMSQIKRTLAENGGPAAQSAVRVPAAQPLMPRPIPRDDTAAADDFGVPPTAPLPPPPYPSELAAGGSPPQHAEGFADGLITLGHAAEHAAGTLMDAPRAAGAAGEAHASTSGKKAGRKRKRSESLQLELNEDDVIAELYARGLVTENPSEDPKAFKGGRPPLGMGPLKRVKTLYTSRKLTMEDWRMFYAEKCRQNGYSGSFRKDLRPRFYVSGQSPASAQAAMQQTTAAVSAPAGGKTDLNFPASREEDVPSADELRLLRRVLPEVAADAEAPEGERLAWNPERSDAENLAALRAYFDTHRPRKMRRGHKPDGIAHFPYVFDLWAMSMIDSAQFQRAAKAAGVPLAELSSGVKAARAEKAAARAAARDADSGVEDEDDYDEEEEEEDGAAARNGVGVLDASGELAVSPDSGGDGDAAALEQVAAALAHGARGAAAAPVPPPASDLLDAAAAAAEAVPPPAPHDDGASGLELHPPQGVAGLPETGAAHLQPAGLPS